MLLDTLCMQRIKSHKWGAMEYYQLAMDSGVLGIERCADVIIGLY